MNSRRVCCWELRNNMPTCVYPAVTAVCRKIRCIYTPFSFVYIYNNDDSLALAFHETAICYCSETFPRYNTLIQIRALLISFSFFFRACGGIQITVHSTGLYICDKNNSRNVTASRKLVIIDPFY